MKKTFLLITILAMFAFSAQAAIVLTNDWESAAEGWDYKPQPSNLTGTQLIPQADINGQTGLSITGGILNQDVAPVYIYDDNGGSGYGDMGALSLSFDLT